jgi:predicted DNA-binding protein
MNTITTNLRFPADEYQDIKLLAFHEGRSIASLIRHAVSLYKNNNFTSSVKVSLVEKFKKMAVKIDISTLNLVKYGRKFE